MTPVLGAMVGAHRLEEIVASDDLGTVYAAHDERGGRHLVRLLTPLFNDPAARRRFQMELAAIARLDHPCILRVEDWGEWQGTPYVVTPDPGAEQLSTILASGRRLNPRFVLRTLRDLATALDYAHQFGVVHGSVDAARVLVGADGSVRLSDFGLALLAGAEPGADVYALAAVARDMLAIAPPPPAHLVPAVDAVLYRGLAEDPRYHWETCGALVDALEAALSGRTAGAPAPTSPLLQRLSALREQLGPLPRRLPLWIALGGAAVLVLVVVIVLAGQGLRPSPTLDLTPPTARPGDAVVVNGGGLPAGQPGSVMLLGRVEPVGQFQADGQGTFKVQFTVPLDVTGNQTVEACWGGSCPVSKPLVVLVAPTTVPSDVPTVVPVVTPTAVSATPTPSSRHFQPSISVSSPALRRGETVQVDGRGFDPSQQYVIALRQNGQQWLLQSPASPDGSGSFADPVQIPGNARKGRAVITACVSLVGSGQPTSCAQQQVLVTG